MQVQFVLDREEIPQAVLIATARISRQWASAN